MTFSTFSADTYSDRGKVEAEEKGVGTLIRYVKMMVWKIKVHLLVLT